MHGARLKANTQRSKYYPSLAQNEGGAFYRVVYSNMGRDGMTRAGGRLSMSCCAAFPLCRAHTRQKGGAMLGFVSNNMFACILPLLQNDGN